MADASLTWLGHATFRLDTPGGKRIYVDPWLDNPKCPDSEKEPERVDVIAITHGHSDHVGATVELTKKFGLLPVVALVELKGWLDGKGAKMDELPGPNKGGMVEHDGVKFTVTKTDGRRIQEVKLTMHGSDEEPAVEPEAVSTTSE